MSNVKNKVILVTGASRGIGADIARLLGANGATVIVNYSSSAAGADEVVKEIKENGGIAIAVKADVSKSAEVKKLFDTCINTYGRLDVLINNAGIMITKGLKDGSEEDFNRQFDINVKGVFYTLREASTRLADNGIILNFSSSTTRMMLPGYGLYSATKAAVEQMSRVFSKEIGRGISVNVIAPGPTNTDLFLEGKSPELIARLAAMNVFNRLAETSDISKVVLFLVSDDSKWITGQVIPVNGGSV